MCFSSWRLMILKVFLVLHKRMLRMNQQRTIHLELFRAYLSFVFHILTTGFFFFLFYKIISMHTLIDVNIGKKKDLYFRKQKIVGRIVLIIILSLKMIRKNTCIFQCQTIVSYGLSDISEKNVDTLLLVRKDNKREKK